MHSRLQTEQQVGQAGFSGSGHVGVGAAAVFPQVWLAGSGQRVAHLVVLSDELLPGGQRLATLRTHSQRQHHNTLHDVSLVSALQRQKVTVWVMKPCSPQDLSFVNNYLCTKDRYSSDAQTLFKNENLFVLQKRQSEEHSPSQTSPPQTCDWRDICKLVPPQPESE